MKVKEPNVNITWLPTFNGECNEFGYLIYYRKVFSEVNTGQWNVVNVSQYNATNHILKLKCYMEYEITVNTQSANGNTPLNRSKLWKVKTGGGKYSQKNKNFKKYMYFYNAVINVTISPSVAFISIAL